MTTPRARSVVAVAVILLIFIVGFLRTRRHDVEPSYQGRTLSRWLADIDAHSSHPDRESPKYLQASNAVAQIGTNGLPFLMEWIQYEPSPAYRLFGGAIEGLRKGLNELPDGIVPEAFSHSMYRIGKRGPIHRSGAAEYGLILLEQQLKPVIPQLAAVAENSPSHSTSAAATRILRAAGPAAWSEIVRLAVNTNSWVSSAAIYGLSPMGTNARPAIPALIHHLRGRDKYAAREAARVLGDLQLEPMIVVPALVQALTSSEPQVRIAAAAALAKFGAHGSPALPELKLMLTDSSSYLRSAASNSIQGITAALAAASSARSVNGSTPPP